MFRILQAHVFPGFSTIKAFIYAVAETHVATADVLTGPHPHGIGVIGIKSNAADGIRSLIVENRRPGGACIFGFPYAPGTHGNVPRTPVIGMDGDIADTSRHQRWTDVPELQTGIGTGFILSFFAFFAFFSG